MPTGGSQVPVDCGAHVVPDSSPAELGRAFEKLLQNHVTVYSTNMKRVIESFNLNALQQQATQIMQSQCTGCYATAQGGFNTVFILTFERGPDIIARLSGSGTGQDDTMSADDLEQRFLSEVATLCYVKKKTTIPVPEVYHAISTADNPVGARYMLMQRIRGQSLMAPWGRFSPEERRRIITQLADFQAQLLTLTFPTIGCIVDNNGTVGPLGLSCTYPFMLKKNNRGPFASSKDFLLAHVHAELDLLTIHPAEWTEQREYWAACNGGFDDVSRENAITWLQLLLDGIKALPDQLVPTKTFVLFHDDFNSGNILVSWSDPAEVVGILDWEGSRISPLWDPGRLCSVLNETEDGKDPEEFRSLKELQQGILQQAQLYTGYSKLHLPRLLHIIDYGHSFRSTQSHLDELFLQWFDGVCGTGRRAQITSFEPLKKFIEVGRLAVGTLDASSNYVALHAASTGSEVEKVNEKEADANVQDRKHGTSGTGNRLGG
ncbi:kinase-like domain-containing protein [Mycena leptocephala]|nr:kinase-like domain-containing protein [Mycena leptocephala]